MQSLVYTLSISPSSDSEEAGSTSLSESKDSGGEGTSSSVRSSKKGPGSLAFSPPSTQRGDHERRELLLEVAYEILHHYRELVHHERSGAGFVYERGEKPLQILTLMAGREVNRGAFETQEAPKNSKFCEEFKYAIGFG